MATQSANALMKEMQKIASNAQIQVQKLANQATEKSFKYNTQEANTAREFNRVEAEKSRQWQEQMSNTAHQREVDDLKKAGLNPVLSANSGAQSYTTSSAQAQAASANANDPSSTVGALAGQMMQGKIGAYQADTSAAATRYAAAQSANATRFAAAANLSAAREAASASRYAADKHYEAQKYTVDHSKQGAVINMLQSGMKNAGKWSEKEAYKASISNLKTMSNNRDTFLIRPDIKASAATLTKAGKLRATREFNRYGIKNTYENRDIFAKAFIDNDKNAMKKWIQLINNNKKAVNKALSINRSWNF